MQGPRPDGDRQSSTGIGRKNLKAATAKGRFGLDPDRPLPRGRASCRSQPTRPRRPWQGTSGGTSEPVSHVWTAGDGSILTGVWMRTSCRAEMMTILEGAAMATGKAEAWAPDDTFFTPGKSPVHLSGST